MSASLARLVRIAARFLRFAALPAVLALSGLPAQALAGAPIRIGTVVWVGYGPFYVADALGMFKKAGLNVELKMFADPVEIPPRSLAARCRAAW